MGLDGTCLCCGIGIKDQLHLFRCEHSDVILLIHLSKKVKLRFIKDGLLFINNSTYDSQDVSEA
jgi:hypothetical protein